MKNYKAIFLCMLFYGIYAPARGQYLLQDFFPELTFNLPVELVSPSDQTNRIFVLSQTGRIIVFNNYQSVGTTQTFLDINNKIVSGGERGLLGMAFHPDFATNGYFYLNYTVPNPLRTVIARYQVKPDNPNQADPNSETILLTIEQPYNNHNGGKIAFGKDGYLYIAVGDGGSAGDPLNHGQNRATLLGNILRIDVNITEGNLNYGIPADNPYKGNMQGFREEIYAYGLRNPWKFAVDGVTGDIWAADVGQSAREEINLITNGGNYGWNTMEGKICYKPSQNCDTVGLIKPIWDYSQDNGDRSITGGFVYRGKNIPALYGKYIYGDYVSGRIWALSKANNGTVSNELLLETPYKISTFGEDENKEIYVANHTANGKLYRLACPHNAEQPVIMKISNDSIMSSINGDAYEWYLNDTLLPLNSVKINVMQTTSRILAYKVRVKQNGCYTSLSAPYIFNVSGISTKQAVDIQVYPNPASKLLQLIAHGNLGKQPIRLSICNSKGQKISEQTVSPSNGVLSSAFDLANFPSGIYALILETQYGAVTKRFIKE